MPPAITFILQSTIVLRQCPEFYLKSPSPHICLHRTQKGQSPTSPGSQARADQCLPLKYGQDEQSTLHGHPAQIRACAEGAWQGPRARGGKLWDLQASQGSLDRLVSRMRPKHMQGDGHVGMSPREQTGIKGLGHSGL